MGFGAAEEDAVSFEILMRWRRCVLLGRVATQAASRIVFLLLRVAAAIEGECPRHDAATVVQWAYAAVAVEDQFGPGCGPQTSAVAVVVEWLPAVGSLE